jgi:hypothetical protein
MHSGGTSLQGTREHAYPQLARMALLRLLRGLRLESKTGRV